MEKYYEHSDCVPETDSQDSHDRGCQPENPQPGTSCSPKKKKVECSHMFSTVQLKGH